MWDFEDVITLTNQLTLGQKDDLGGPGYHNCVIPEPLWSEKSSLAVCRLGHKTQTDTKTHTPTHSTSHRLLLFAFYLTFGKKSSTSHWHLTGSLNSINPPGVGGSRELPREENAFINSRTDFSQEKLGPTLKKKPGNQIFLYSCRTESLNPNTS